MNLAPASPTGTITTLPEYASTYGDHDGESIDADLAEGSSPPEYAPSAPRTASTVTYTLTPTTTSNGFTLQGQDSTGAVHPQYHINANTKAVPFAPLLVVTTVRRDTPNGPLVGQTEMSSTHPRAGIVIMGNVAQRISNVLQTLPAVPAAAHWKWKFDDVDLRWDCSKNSPEGIPIYRCYRGARTKHMATFMPAPLGLTPPFSSPRLIVFPSGQEMFEHILMSALVLEHTLLIMGRGT
ncbi:hypothetical protein BD410DRAFT_785373 [Rickenella mellea]|uniref:Uncharacterized protein n=1 Tax=Rickenella mellea TaxID=50990 RepID=A0A4Y7QCY2_9AGAM|nr:hypothetical protein BD410DRAFT_785373 [Rickenella mellea]